jgi:putative tryptophan/tyrosine transport system substrate-binding protein
LTHFPSIYFSRDFVDAGGLMSYGPNLVDAYRLVGVYTEFSKAKLSRKCRLSSQPSSSCNQSQSHEGSGLSLPQSILLRADEVIE